MVSNYDFSLAVFNVNTRGIQKEMGEQKVLQSM